MGTLTQSGATVSSFHFTYLGQPTHDENTHVFRVVPGYDGVLCPRCNQPVAPHHTDEVIVDHPTWTGLCFSLRKRSLDEHCAVVWRAAARLKM